MEQKSVNGAPSREKESILLNVRGTKFELFVNSLERFRTVIQIGGILDESKAGSTRSEFFLNRNPACFAAIADYIETGVLHCPAGVCGAQFRQELLYWGIDEGQIQKCCINDYINAIETERKIRLIAPSLESRYSTAAFGNRRIQSLLWNILSNPGHSRWSKIYFAVSTLLLIINIALTVLEAVVANRALPLDSLRNTSDVKCEAVYDFPEALLIIFKIDLIFSLFFTVELIVRGLCAPNLRALYANTVIYIDLFNLTAFYAIFCILTMTDVEKECPYMIGWIISTFITLRILRIVRLIPVLYAFNLFKTMMCTLRASLREILTMFLFVIILTIITGTLITVIEQSEDSHFRDVLSGFWFAIVTITTIGYGDTRPISLPGKLLTTLLAPLGLLVVALAVPMIGANYHLVSTYISGRGGVWSQPHVGQEAVVVTGAADEVEVVKPASSEKSGKEDAG